MLDHFLGLFLTETSTVFFHKENLLFVAYIYELFVLYFPFDFFN